MLAILHAKALTAGLEVTHRLVQGAMESFRSPRRYALVLVPSSSFQLLTDEAAAAQAMTRFHDALLPGGILVMPWIDVASDHPDGADDVDEQSAELADGTTIRRSCRLVRPDHEPGTHG